MKYNRSSRRMFLQGAGAMLAVPLLESLLPRQARAQSAPVVKRFISIISSYDMGHHAGWLPRDGSPITNLGQPPRTFDPGSGHPPIRYQPLRELVPTSSASLSVVAGTALNPYLESLNILRSLDHTIRYGHGGAQVLGGIAGPRDINPDRGALETIETADVVLNKNRAFNPAGLPLAYCGNPGFGPDAYSYASAGGAAASSASIGEELLGLYNRLFQNGNYPENGGTSTAHPKFNILSRVIGDYRRVRASRNISAADRIVLDNAVDQFSDVERSLTRASTAQCSHRALNRAGLVSQSAADPVVGRALADLIMASIMCDTARVFTIGAPLLGGTVDGQADDHQSISHVPFDQIGSKPSWQITSERQGAVIRNLVAPLVSRLSSAIDPANGRSYLYNSLTYFTAESGLAHGYGSHPVMLLGNAGGALSSGNYVDYADRSKGPFVGGDSYSEVPGEPTFSNNWYGASYNRLLVTILQAMGLSPADYENDALNAQLYGRTDIGANYRNLTSLGGFGYALPRDITGADTSSWGWGAYVRPGLEGLDLRLFRRPLPLPPG